MGILKKTLGILGGAAVGVGAGAAAAAGIAKKKQKNKEEKRQLEEKIKELESEGRTRCIGCKAPITGKKGAVAICKYCDTEQTL